MALKLRENIRNSFTLPVGAAALSKGDCVKISSSLLIVTTGNEAHVGIVTEDADANATNVRVAGVGSIVQCLAHDTGITENQWVVPAADGRVDGIATLTTTTQYPVGIALQASSVQDGLISVLLVPSIATKAAS